MKYISGAVGVILLIYFLSMSRVSIFGEVCYIAGHAKAGKLFGADVTHPVCIYPSIYYMGIIISLVLIAISAMLIAKEILISPASSKAPSASNYRQSSQPYPAYEGSARVETNAATPASTTISPAWKTLKEFDTDIQEAVAKLSGFGPQAEERLASAYLAVNDKGLLASIVAKIATDEEKEATAREEERARRAESMLKRKAELLADRERRAQYTIDSIKAAGMVYAGRKVVSAEMYSGENVSHQGWAKIVYENGRAELRAGSEWMRL